MSTTVFKQITWEQWEEEYIPISNPYHQDPSNIYYLESVGEDGEYIKNYPHKDRIWTLMDNGDIINGWHFINRQGYYITEKPFLLHEIIEVKDEDEDEEDPEYDGDEGEDEDDGTKDGIFT